MDRDSYTAFFASGSSSHFGNSYSRFFFVNFFYSKQLNRDGRVCARVTFRYQILLLGVPVPSVVMPVFLCVFACVCVCVFLSRCTW